MPEIHPFVSGLWNIHLPQQESAWFDNGISFGYIPDKDVKSLFLGTFPTYHVANFNHLNNNKAFFYGSSVNGLWPIFSAISGQVLHDEESIFDFLQNAKFGMIDILTETERQEESASDAALTPIAYNDIINLFQSFPNLNKIYVTSGGRSTVTNASPNSASKFFRDSLIYDNYIVDGFNVQSSVKNISISLNHTLIKRVFLISLHSPSSNANTPLQGIINRNPDLNNIFNLFPQNLLYHSPSTKLRILQWAYYLNDTDFPICNEITDILDAHELYLNQLFD